MKTKILFLLLLAGSNGVFSQDLKSVQRLMAQNDYTGAKKEVDLLMAAKNAAPDPAAWFYKAKVYTAYARQQDSTAPELLRQAFDAFKKYQEQDSKGKLMELENNLGLFQLFDLSYNSGIRHYNGEDYAKAYGFFRNALDVEEYSGRRGYSFQGQSFPAFDTALINLTGSAAYLSGRQQESIPYFEKLADAGIRGEDYKPVYSLLVQYHLQKSNAPKATKYLRQAKALYPDPGYWAGLELAGVTGKERFARYDDLVKENPGNVKLALDYAAELYNYLHADQRPSDYAVYEVRLRTLIRAIIEQDPNQYTAHYIMTQHLGNEIFYMDQIIRDLREEVPAEAAKKKSLKERQGLLYVEMYPYAIRAFDMSQSDSAVATADQKRKVLRQLISYHLYRKEPEQVKYYRGLLN